MNVESSKHALAIGILYIVIGIAKGIKVGHGRFHDVSSVMVFGVSVLRIQLIEELFLLLGRSS